MAEIKYLEINADDRSIIIPEGENLLGVENDNKGVRKYFICPKIVGDNIDLTKSDVYINVQNASGEKSGKDRYPVQNMTASGDNVTFEWVLERKVTSHKGSVRFAVCVREKGSEREWHTTFATGNALEGEELFESAELEARGQDFIGILTSDANADANSIESGKSAYVNGKKIEGSGATAHDKTGALITGSIPVNSRLTGAVKEEDVKYSKEQTDFGTLYHININPRIYPSDKQEQIILRGDQQRCNMYIPANFFGNASPSEVKKGVTFTSINGLKATGTADMSGGISNNNCEAYLVDVTNPTVSFKTASGTIKAYGYAYETTKSQWGGSTTTTVYAFNGTNYYKSAFYGSPAATNITLGVSGGKLTGLPTGLSGGTLLVVRGI